jgi:hypothetical protein
MLKHIQVIKSELFQKLSEQEQETVFGGCYNHLPFGMFFYQQRNIQSDANIETKFSDSDSEFSNRITSVYSLSETTFLFIPFFGGSRGSRSVFNGSNMNWLRDLFF